MAQFSLNGQSPASEMLTHYEAEHIIEGIEAIDIREYGSPQWFK